MKLDSPAIENNIVRLEIFGPEHYDFLLGCNAVEYMWKWMPAIPSGTSFNSYVEYIRALKDEGEIVPFAIFRKSDNAFAGVVAYGLVSRLHRRVRIAYAWHPEDMRGTLIFPATQAALIQRALDWGARRIAWTIDVRNEAALAAFERLGARREGVLRAFMRMSDGTWADHCSLSMIRDEAKAAVALINERIRASLAENNTTDLNTD